MFDLELNIKSWCDYLRSSGKLNEEDVLELENHLREQIDELIAKGLSEEEAFLISVKRLGNVNKISDEYSKVNTDDLWKQLLADPVDEISKKRKRQNILLVILLALLAGTAAKLPTFFGINIDNSIRYFKNLSFYLIPFIVIYFIIKHNINKKLIGYVSGIFAVTALIINLYPSYEPNHTAMLTGIHLPIMLWLVTGIAYIGDEWKTKKGRMDFLRFTGECFIYGSLIMFGFFVLMMFTSLIFQSISIDIEIFIENYFIFYGPSAGAILAVYLVETKKSIVENFAPVLAKIFSPLFLITMLTFLIVVIFTGKSPFVERNFLIGFDLMLVLVLGLVLYTISARKMYDKKDIFDYLNGLLIFVAIIVDSIALSAILFRLTEYGISPNKLAALGENVLLLINLAGLLWLYLKYFRDKVEFNIIEKWQTNYLTVYAIWMAVVVFIFPLIFKFQ
ncbi:MAG: permease prefix domain 1-containing protein [Bacillota bacterium]